MLLPTILAPAALIAAGDLVTAGTATVEDVANSAAMCMLSAGTDSADKSRFENDAWVPSEGGYRHVSAPVTIEFPADKDGIARICVVHAVLAEKGDQTTLAKKLNDMLKTKALKQSSSDVWVVSTTTGFRGIQFYTDNQSDQPKVRLIGAAF
tara:strand:- start:115 stop:570 length:456 start_codon:yes stop_codon:yes gene_type:complete